MHSAEYLKMMHFLSVWQFSPFLKTSGPTKYSSIEKTIADLYVKVCKNLLGAGFLSKEDIIGQRRHRPLVTARQIAMYVFRELTELSYPAIAREFGGRDHTTVIHAVDKISELMSAKQTIYDQVTELIHTIKTGK